jgi:hypothetical protein
LEWLIEMLLEINERPPKWWGIYLRIEQNLGGCLKYDLKMILSTKFLPMSLPISGLKWQRPQI